MSSPSAVLAKMVTRIKAGMCGADVDVRVWDFPFDTGDSASAAANTLIPTGASVFLTCLGANLVPVEQPPSLADCAFAAFCFARNTQPAQQKHSRGAVAMDLAYLVASIVDGDKWADPAVVRYADRTRVTNETSRAWIDKGLSVWTVAWTQRLELEGSVCAAELNRLGTITFTLEQGGSSAPDAQARIDFPETAP